MKYQLENEYLLMTCSSDGAEIKSIVFKPSGREAIWQADPDYWARHAPVLFPVVGKVTDNMIVCRGKSYPISQHGFARDRVFEMTYHDTQNIHFLLKSDDESIKFYPFAFELHIKYNLDKRLVRVVYTVINPGAEILPFSIGAHPGFALNIPPDDFTDYKIVFEKPEYATQYRLEQGLIGGTQTPSLLSGNSHITLTKDLFNHDALIFEGIQSSTISLEHLYYGQLIRLHAKGYPYVGIWSKPGAPFVCIEPWHGIADFTGQPRPFEQKIGIIHLAPQQQFECQYCIEVLQ